MNCKFCQSPRTMKYGFKAGTQYYKCKSCGRKFSGREAPEGMRFSTATVGEALGLFYDGLSLSDISRHLATTDGVFVNPSSVWRWVIHYSKHAHKFLDQIKVSTSKIWVIDETVIKVAGQKGNIWLWDIIDDKSRYLLDTHLSVSRSLHDAIAVLTKAQTRSKTTPRLILSDGLAAYPDAVEQVFGADARHVRMEGLNKEININLIERFHGTVKERTKVMRGLKTMATARIILDGFIVHYNFLRPHMTLKGKTPALVAGAEVGFATWKELVDILGKFHP